MLMLSGGLYYIAASVQPQQACFSCSPVDPFVYALALAKHLVGLLVGVSLISYTRREAGPD